MTKLQTLAGEVSRYFTTDKRNDGTEFVKTTDDRPDWVQEMCHAAHGDMLPDDWRYQFISDAVDALAENEDPDEIQLEADIYTHDLTGWLHSRTDRYAYCDEAITEYGLDLGDKREGNPTIMLLSWGQYHEKQEVLGAVRCFLEGRIEDEDETEDGENVQA